MGAVPLGLAETRIITCTTIEGLRTMTRTAPELVVWRRTLPLCLGRWLDRLPPFALPTLRVLVGLDDLRETLSRLLDSSGMPPGPMRTLLVEDIRLLAHAFAAVAGTEQVDCRLERVEHDACWKFHRDCVAVRLLTTYRGPGTEWVAPCEAERALRDQKSFTGPIERLRPHDVAVFKGSRAGPGGGIVHRSPAVAGAGLARLLLCLNAPAP